MNKILKYIVLLLLFFTTIDRYSSYVIEHVTKTDYVYNSYSTYYECSYGYLILCTETNQDDSCSSLDFTFGIGSNISATQTFLVLSNETSKLFTVYISTFLGQHSVTINSLLTINLECLRLDLDKVSLQLSSNGYFNMFKGDSFGLNPCASFKMVGDVYPNVSLHGMYGYDYKYYSRIQNIPFSTNYIFESAAMDTKTNLSAITFTFNSGTTSKNFVLDPIGKDKFDNIYNIKTYPDSQYLSDLELFGFGQSAMIQFTSNNTALSNYYTMNINGQSSITQITPIYGDEFSTTYLYTIRQYNAPSNLYEFYYVSNAEFKKSAISLSNINITNYKIQPYPFNNNYLYLFNESTIPMVTFGFYDKAMKDFHQLVLFGNNKQLVSNYPFGFSFVSPYRYNMNVTIPICQSTSSTQYFQYISTIDSSGVNFNFEYNNTQQIEYQLGPTVTNYEFIRVVEDIYIVRIYIKAPYGFSKMTVTQLLTTNYGKEALVSGDLYDGVYEVVTITSSDLIFEIYDIYNNRFSLKSPTYLTISPTLKIFISPAYLQNVNLFAMYNVSYLYNDIDVTNRRHYNVLYFSLPDNFPKDYQVGILFINSEFLATPTLTSNPIDSQEIFFNSWNETLQKHQIEFYVEANTQVGLFSFWVLFNLKVISSGVLDGQLRIKKSNMDLFGPKFKQIKKIIPTKAISRFGSIKIGRIGWSFQIEDPVNGFDYGYVVITGQLDKSIYNMSISSSDVKPGGNLYLGEYDVTLSISAPCISQNYVITEVILYDRVSRVSVFNIASPSSYYSGVSNPFIYYLNDPNINSIALNCSNDPITSTDTTPPVLSAFSSSKQVMDVSETNRKVSFEFTATDLESGIKNQQTPIVYLVTTNLVLLECKSSIVSINSTSANYVCSIDLPISFGYPNDSVLLSVYGLVNNNGYSSGYSSTQLLESGLQYYLNTTFKTNEPSITGHYKFRDTGGDLFLFGKCLDSSSSAYLTFNDGPSISITPIVISSTVVKIPRVRATDHQFKVYIKTLSYTSNTITVTPMKYDFYLPVPAPTFPPTVTPVPTNAPQLCPGKPECGGPSNGKCIPNQGCVCYSPWIGTDCLSQIIVVNPPIINTGNNSHGSQGSQSSDDNGSGSPTIEIIVPDATNNNTNNNGNNNINTRPVTYSSLISIAALREVDIYGGIVKSFTFEDNWLSRQLDTLTYAFYTFIDVGNNQQTNVTAILKWFTNQTTISFANEEFIMNPSSMKYTIEIDNYPFQNSLNQLQLVMSALIQSNTTENVCSVKEFGETTQGDNSNYLKIQVDNHSLYGRFIRRGIVDSQIRTITNVQLDKDMRPITSTKSLQSYIGIQIPNYQNSVIIDPDFSVILDSYSASLKPNSICSSNNKLSAGKIAGIAVGAAAFAAALGVSLAYYLMKNREENKFLSSVNNKMNEISNKDYS